MAIETDFPDVEKGQDLTFPLALVTGATVAAYVAITDNITTWTWIMEIRQTWGATATVYSNTAPSVNNTTKTVTFTIAKADTQDVECRKYSWQIRRTNSGSEAVWGKGDISFVPPPPAGKTG